MSVLPPNILRCLRPEDRKGLGKAGLLPEEALAKMEIKGERDLQKQIVGLLRIKGIEPIVSAFGKKTTNNVGTPDIIFAAELYACAWEVKIPGGKRSIEQEQMAVRLSTPPNGWRYLVVTSFDQALAELHSIGVQ